MRHDLKYHKNDGGRRSAFSFNAQRKKEISTFGSIPQDRPGFLYVGVSPLGRVKIGMSGEPKQRCAALGIQLYQAIQVRPEAAKEIETGALQYLGHDQGDGEWLRKPDPDLAVLAITHAMAQLRRRIWIDADLTEDEARKLRVRLAADEAAQEAILTAPSRRYRSVSITSHRKAAGVFGHHGSRFG